MTEPFFDRLGNGRCIGGQALRLVLRIRGADGEPGDVTGLPFAYRIFTPGGETLLRIDAIGAGDAVTFELTGAQTMARVGALALQHEIAQIGLTGTAPWVSGTFRAAKGAGLITGSGQVGQSVIVVDARGTLTVSAIGAPGPQNQFIQPTQPVHPGPYTWWDTSNGNLTLWIEDGQ